MKGFKRLRNIWSRKASEDELHHNCARNNVINFPTTTPFPQSKSVTSQVARNTNYPSCKSEERPAQQQCSHSGNNEELTNPPSKTICFQKTVYSDSVIVDAAIPQRKKSQEDSGDRHVQENADVKNEKQNVKLKTQPQQLTRNQVVHMLKSRFKEDLEDWQQRDHRPVDVRSEPSRSPKLSQRKRYGVLIESPTAYPTLPRKTDRKSGAIWLQCEDKIKQVQLPKEGISLGRIRQMFQSNFKCELEKYEFGADRCILLIKDHFSQAFKELEDVKLVLPGSHLKLLGPKKKPCRNRRHQMVSKNVSFEERRRSNSFSSEVSQADSIASAPAGFSRARVGSYSFHGHPYTSSQGTIRRGIKTSTPKPNRGAGVSPSGVLAGEISKVEHNPAVHGNKCHPLQDAEVQSFELTPRPSFNHYDISNSWVNEPNSPTRMVNLPGLGESLGHESKRTLRNPVEVQLASLTNLLQEALRTDSTSDVNSSVCESSMDSLDGPPRPNYLPLNQEKKRSTDSGTESFISEKHWISSDERKTKPPPPGRSSSKDAMRSHSSHSEYNIKEKNQESSKKSIVRPRVWIDTSNRVRDNHIKVTAAYLKKDVKQLRIQLEELRNQHEYNAHVFNTLLSKTGQQIMAAVEGALQDGNEHNVSLQKRKLLAEETAYQRRSDHAEKTMRRLENEIEMLRDGAVNHKSNVKENEVDEIHGSIEDVSRSIASLKSDFEALSKDARASMTDELQSLLEEESFLKEEPSHLDQLANRCRHAAGTLFTLQKLASAQSADSSNGRGILSSFGQKSKVEYAGQKGTVDYNQNTISPVNGMKAKVRFNDSADHTTYHQ